MKDDEPENMKLGKHEIEMKTNISATLGSRENDYRFTVPQKLEINVFAGKKRKRNQDGEEDSGEERRMEQEAQRTQKRPRHSTDELIPEPTPTA